MNFNLYKNLFGQKQTLVCLMPSKFDSKELTIAINRYKFKNKINII